jgi:hypothetical protein
MSCFYKILIFYSYFLIDLNISLLESGRLFVRYKQNKLQISALFLPEYFPFVNVDC